MDVLGAWLGVIARDGWPAARLGAVAHFAGIDASQVAITLPDRWAALRAYGERLDRAALAEAEADRGASVRDRLFAMLMERFDAAQAERAAAQALAAAGRRDPGLAAFILVSTSASMARIADAAGVETTGWLGPVRVQALTVLYLQVSRTWLADESADLATTMKVLDSMLARGERWAAPLSGAQPVVAALEVAPKAAAAPRSVVDPVRG